MWWDNQNMDKCKVADTCSYKGKANCEYGCFRYHTAKETYKLSNLPPNALKPLKLIPEDCDLHTYEVCNSFKGIVSEHVDAGNGLYLYGDTKGNGKTSWAFKIMNEYLSYCAFHYPLDYEIRGYYVNVSELFDLLRNSMGKEGRIEAIEKGIYDAGLVIFDDIGFEKSTDWVKNKLYNYINYRYQNNKSMIFTSNLSLAELSARLDDRISDRISEICMPLHFTGQGRRQSDRWWEDKK